MKHGIIGFNPCFSGSCSRIIQHVYSGATATGVSILVLVDLAHEYFPFVFPSEVRTFVSILVLVDLAHELNV